MLEVRNKASKHYSSNTRYNLINPSQPQCESLFINLANCRAVSVSERSEANDRVSFEILLCIYNTIYIIIFMSAPYASRCYSCCMTGSNICAIAT